jgi:NCAIR mutase (PurE)-related protein
MTGISGKGYDDLGFAKIDTLREQRTGQPEVIFGEGKTPAQIVSIMKRMIESGSNVLATRISAETAEAVRRHIPEALYNPAGRTLRVMLRDTPSTDTYIAIVSAGTADLPVVEEACETALFLHNRVERVTDVGVAGIHRLFDKLDVIRQARVVIVVAGMEGALASVIAGLTDRPVIAVPTSAGYGANLQGIATLLSMLNSCTTLSVVNIDNGFGAASQASRINRLT